MTNIWPRRLFYRFGGRRHDPWGPWGVAPAKGHIGCDLCDEARRVRTNGLSRGPEAA